MKRLSMLWFAASCLILGQTLVVSDFEDGSAQGWIPRGGGVSLTVTDEAAASGTRSLRTTGRTQGFHGPSLPLDGKLAKGATYRISAAVRLVAGQSPAPVKITMQRTPAGATAAQFDQIAASSGDVTDAAWTTLSGQYLLSSEASGLLLYVESPDATVSYLLDDFSMVMIAPPPDAGAQDTSGIRSDFESNAAEGWKPRIGGERLEVTADDAHSGQYCLRVSNRQRAFEGAKIDATGKINQGSRYTISLWLKLAPGQSASSLRLSMERSLQGTTTYHTIIGNTAVTSAAWVKLSTVFDMGLAYDAISLYVESADGAASFLVDDFEVAYVPPVAIQQDIPSVAETLADFFPVGAAISPAALQGPHLDLLKKHFNSITAGNEMKWSSLRPNEATFNFTDADRLANFARANGFRMRGHTLAWHSQVPAWLFQDAKGAPLAPGEASKQLVLDRLRTHIREVVTRYKDAVYAWDVVNEAIDPSQPDCMRRSPWYTLTGLDFIDVAFQTTREIAPDAKLFYNDYDTTNVQRRACMLKLITGMQARGVPIDGMGHQMHINVAYPQISSIIDTIQMFANLGVGNEVTELDVSLYTDDTSRFNTIPDSLLQLQARRYREFFDAMRSMKGMIGNVTIWGMADDDTWLKTFPITRLDLPLLFDEQLQAKPAYWAVVDPNR